MLILIWELENQHLPWSLFSLFHLSYIETAILMAMQMFFAYLCRAHFFSISEAVV